MSKLLFRKSQVPADKSSARWIVLALAICATALWADHRVWAQTDALETDGGDNPRDISGVWWIATYEPTIRPMDGDPIPFTPAGQDAYENNINGLRDGTVDDFAVTLCVPMGIVRTMGSPYPFEVIQTPGQITILMEANNVYRVIRLDSEHSEEAVEIFPGFMGDQIGYWEDDTLVVDTLGVKPYTWLDASGAPHGYDLHTVERIRKIEGGRRLENVITVEDNEFFTMPWRVRYVYEPRPDVSIEVHPCGVHRDLSGVSGVVQ